MLAIVAIKLYISFIKSFPISDFNNKPDMIFALTIQSTQLAS